MASKNGNGGKLEKIDGVTDIVPIVPEVADLVEKVTSESLVGIQIDRIVNLEAGQMVRGKYLGTGPEVEVHDVVTGEVRNLVTHRIEVRPNIVVRLIESFQLKRELPPLLNKRVRVIKVGQVDTRRGTRVNDWVVAPELNQETTSAA